MRMALLAFDSGLRFLICPFFLQFAGLDTLVGNVLSAPRWRHQLTARERTTLSRWITALASRLSRNPCLVHALVLFSLDRDATFYLGVANHQGFQSHAWVEADGRIYSTVSDVGLYRSIFCSNPHVS